MIELSWEVNVWHRPAARPRACNPLMKQEKEARKSFESQHQLDVAIPQIQKILAEGPPPR